MIKKILRSILLFSFALVSTNYLWHNLTFQREIETLLIVALILSLFEIILKPILNLLLLPITIITLGAIRIIIDTLGLYLATFFINEFTVNTINTSGVIFQGFSIPKFHFEGIIAYIVTSISISFCYHFFSSIVKRKITK